MKNAEDKLYTCVKIILSSICMLFRLPVTFCAYFTSFICRVWKEITLNSTSDQVEYRVWDYPIKEQYGHILQAITQVGPVKTTEEGFKKVEEEEKEKKNFYKFSRFSLNPES